MSSQLKNLLQQELKHLAQLESTLEFIGSSNKKQICDSVRKLPSSSKFSQISKDSKFVRDLTEQFNAFSASKKRQQKQLQNPLKPSRLTLSEQFEQKQTFQQKRWLNSGQEIRESNQKSKKQQKNKLELQLDVLKRTLILKKHLKRYGLKLQTS